MFSPDIVCSDAFLDMPPSTQALYFHLAVRADDDGFVNPKMIMRLIGSPDDDLKVLLAKRFVLKFESGVVVIKHWLIHNLIRADLYKETLYLEEKNIIGVKDNGAYTELRDGVSPLKKIEAPEWLKRRRGESRTADVPFAVPRLGKVRLGKVNIGKNPPIKKQKPVDELWIMGINPFLGKYAPSLINEFTDYWRQKNTGGIKELWQTKKVFDFGRRLSTWKRNQEKWQFENEQRKNVPRETSGTKRKEATTNGPEKINFN
ncbi:MAG: hypothetical protein AAB456_01590 [Patescibacteria group bacterium]